MTQAFSQNNMKKRLSVLVFLKGTTAPLVLYTENPPALYEELTKLMKTSGNVPQIIEKTTNGPIKKVSLLSNQICAVGLQEEPYMQI